MKLNAKQRLYSALNYTKMQDQANKLHDKAKDGSIKIRKDTYNLIFDRNEGVYIALDSKGDPLTRFNTRLLPVAKKWLIEYLED